MSETGSPARIREERITDTEISEEILQELTPPIPTVAARLTHVCSHPKPEGAACTAFWDTMYRNIEHPKRLRFYMSHSITGGHCRHPLTFITSRMKSLCLRSLINNSRSIRACDAISALEPKSGFHILARCLHWGLE